MGQGLDHMKPINQMMKFNGFDPFLYTTTVPTYYGGLTAMFMYGKSIDLDRYIDDLGFRHYSMEVHAAAFAIPKWLKEIVNDQ